MLSTFKTRLRNTSFGNYLWNLRQNMRNRKGLKVWEASGRPAPPPHPVKQSILNAYTAAFHTGTLIETGTFLGQMVEAMRPRYKQIYSIELSADLATAAQRRFRAYPQIHIVQGDSGERMPEILSQITSPCLFWLDGHYSGGFTAKGALDTPVTKEVETILAHSNKDHVILIDDARCFDGTEGYPTIAELRALFAERRPDYGFSVANDVIRIHPKKDVQSQY